MDGLARFLGGASPWAYAAAGFAGLVVLALLPPPRRLRPVATDDQLAVRRSGWLHGRADALPIGRRAWLGAALGIAGAVVAVRGGVAPGVAGAGAVVVALGVVVLLGRLEPSSTRRRRRVLVLQAPQALELMASCLAAGLPVRSACATVVDAFDGPVAEDLGQVRALTDLGVADADAWARLADHEQLGPAAADLARSVEAGTLLVATLRHHARQARERRQAALQVQARAVGVRSVLPLMTCFIPAFLLLGVVPTVASALSRALSL